MKVTTLWKGDIGVNAQGVARVQEEKNSFLRDKCLTCLFFNTMMKLSDKNLGSLLQELTFRGIRERHRVKRFGRAFTLVTVLFAVPANKLHEPLKTGNYQHS